VRLAAVPLLLACRSSPTFDCGWARSGERVTKSICVLLLAAAAALGQTRTGSIVGTVVDAKTQKPIPAAVVGAVRNGLPPLSKSTKSGGDGAFRIEGLPEGSYSLCVQAQGGEYVDLCQWNGSPATGRTKEMIDDDQGSRGSNRLLRRVLCAAD
jgi:hypothetical protein